jgi:NNP family nitrate/nitrite transporter-like MFS transporter
MIGGLGGFVLPIAFGVMNDLTGVWTSCFMLLFALVATALAWMHVTILIMERRAAPALRGPKDLPELGGVNPAKTAMTLEQEVARQLAARKPVPQAAQ